MKNTLSLNRNTLFKRAYSKGKSCANKYLALYVLPGKPEFNRLGITVSKKIGCAVLRNKVRRKIKESYRLSEDFIKTGHTIVIVARMASATADYHKINSALLHLLQKLELLEKGNGDEKSGNISD